MITDPLSQILETLKNLSTQVEAVETKVTNMEDRLPDEGGMAILRNMVRKIETRIAAIEGRSSKQITKQDIDDSIRRANDAQREDINLDIEDKLTKFRDHIMNGISTVAGELKTIREEQSTHQLQHDDLNDIPERVEKLERVFEATPRR